jgi:hypothetical protein
MLGHVDDQASVHARRGTVMPRETPEAFRAGLAAATLSTALALFFFVRSQRMPPGFFSGGLEFMVAALSAFFAAIAFLSLGLAWFFQARSASTAYAATVVGIACGLTPPALVVTFMAMEYLG